MNNKTNLELIYDESELFISFRVMTIVNQKRSFINHLTEKTVKLGPWTSFFSDAHLFVCMSRLWSGCDKATVTYVTEFTDS